MSEPRIYDEPTCGCHRSGATIAVAQLTGTTFGQALLELRICQGSKRATLDCTIIQLITTTILLGTIIESGSQEALWETEAMLIGIEERLLARVRDYYAENVKSGMTAEQALEFQKQVFANLGITPR